MEHTDSEESAFRQANNLVLVHTYTKNLSHVFYT
jgi:hypothetical protein